MFTSLSIYVVCSHACGLRAECCAVLLCAEFISPPVDGDAQSLKEHLIDELDYILLPTEGWNKLVSWYTLMEGQEPIARKVCLRGN